MKKDNFENNNERFIRSGPQWVESATGFVVQSAGRYKIEYVEGDHVLVVPIEDIGDPFKVILYLSEAQKWQPPYDTEPISPDRLREIHSNIMEALKFLKTPFEIK